jgi:DNA-binding NarL/FixJ family response regulator
VHQWSVMAATPRIDFAGSLAPFDADAEPGEASGIHAFIDPETAFRAAVVNATAGPVTPADLGRIWQDLLDGRLCFHLSDPTPSHHRIVARIVPGDERSRVLTEIEGVVLSRVLSGEPQKVIAADLGIACSTTSKWFARALEKLHLSRTHVPLPFVVAAQGWASPARAERARASEIVFRHDGLSYLLLLMPRPVIAPAALLTASEREIAQRLLEGDSRRGIAERRSTSAQTVASQLGAIFAKLSLRGRYPLIRLALDAGWF